MWSNTQETADLVTFTEEILHVKLHFFAHCVVLILPANWVNFFMLSTGEEVTKIVLALYIKKLKKKDFLKITNEFNVSKDSRKYWY